MPQGQQRCLKLLLATATLAPFSISVCLLLIQFSSSFSHLFKYVPNCRLLAGNKHSIFRPRQHFPSRFHIWGQSVHRNTHCLLLWISRTGMEMLCMGKQVSWAVRRKAAAHAGPLYASDTPDTRRESQMT